MAEAEAERGCCANSRENWPEYRIDVQSTQSKCTEVRQVAGNVEGYIERRANVGERGAPLSLLASSPWWEMQEAESHLQCIAAAAAGSRVEHCSLRCDC